MNPCQKKKIKLKKQALVEAQKALKTAQNAPRATFIDKTVAWVKNTLFNA